MVKDLWFGANWCRLHLRNSVENIITGHYLCIRELCGMHCTVALRHLVSLDHKYFS